MAGTLFPMSDYWWFYLGFTALVLVLLMLDLGVFHRKAHAVSFREAAIWTVVWASLAGLFCIAFYAYSAGRFGARLGRQAALEFLTGYVVEWSLSLDNMFVFVVIFTYFGIPAIYQHRILFYGILGALILRAIFIALGAALIQYGWVVVLFGVFLIFTGIRMMFAPEKEIEPEKNPVIKLVHKMMPVSPRLDGQRFFTRINGIVHATPLLLTLALIEMSDVVFAIDSVPAIFAITREPLIVFTSNVFAILGLRSMYFLLAGAVGRFHLLRYGLSLVLIFVGLKMAWLNHAWDGHFPIGISLSFIAGVLAATIALSLAFPRRDAREGK
jgi:tellurite resistance protein TerC